MTVALIDGDIVAFRCACTVKDDDALEIGNWRASVMMDEILRDTGCSEYLLFLSGGENFRKTLYPQYKANRADKPRPRALEPIREYLVLEWNAIVTDGIEADDALGIAANEGTIICTIDKDLLQVPGRHYNFVKKEFRFVDPDEGMRILYKQLLLGDRSDNVPGYDGMARQKPTRQIQAWYDEIDKAPSQYHAFEIVKDAYSRDYEKLQLSMHMLYIQRELDDQWLLPELESQSESMTKTQEEPTP